MTRMNHPDKRNEKQAPTIAKNGMVAASQPLAVEIGVDILQQGGTAVDAAIATNAALGLTEPHMCGLGGDLFAIVWDARSQQLYGLNASGRSPAGLSYSQLKKELSKSSAANMPFQGLLSVSVPGAVDGWFQLHERFGRLPFANLLQPAIKWAEAGFSVTPVIAEEWAQYANSRPSDISGDFAELYQPKGKTPVVGERFINPALAKSYRQIAEKGREAFYQGELADRIDQFMSAQGGYLRKSDLQAHRSEWVDPVLVNYRGYDVFELPPNGQGLAVLQMLKLLEGDDLSSMACLSAEVLHLMIEAKKLVFEDRAKYYADPDFSQTPIAALLSDGYCANRRSLIGGQAAQEVRAGDPLLRQSDTVYLTTADKEGNMVSLIQSIFYGFGSGVVVPETGFALQNRGALFSLDGEHPNVYAPGKRPFQTIIPAFILRDGKPFLSFGVMGGDMQPQGHVQMITHIIDFGLTVQQAGDMKRWRHEGSSEPTGNYQDQLSGGGVVMLEPGIDEQVMKGLAERGHCVKIAEGGYGGYQAIKCNREGYYAGASDVRKDGMVLGYSAD